MTKRSKEDLKKLVPPKVSVIMPVHNGAKYLSSAIDSVFAQTCTEWELIVVDDGSTDATPQILEEYADPKVKKFRQDNAGVAIARNRGLNCATGQYIAFLDADDLYLPTALANLSSFLDRYSDYAAVYSDGYFCDKDEKPLLRLSEHRLDIYTGNILERVVLSPSVVLVPVCTLTRRAVIERYRVRFDERLHIAEDWDFWIQLARVAPFGYLEKLTCMYRVHNTNTTRTSGFQKRKDELVRARMKILNSNWFGELSAPARKQFFNYLLVELLRGQSSKQQGVLESPPFRNLPRSDQADLWRLVGAEYILNETGRKYARDFLRGALTLLPNERKSQFLLWTLETLGKPATVFLLRFWRAMHRFASALRGLGHRRPKPVPKTLALVPD